MVSGGLCPYNCRRYAGDAAWLQLAKRDRTAHHPACPLVRAQVGDVDSAFKFIHDPGQYIYDKLSDRSSREATALRQVVRGEMIDTALEGVALWLLWEVFGNE